MKDTIHILIIILTSFLTLLLEPIIPMEGGGASMIIFLTIPFLIVLSFIISLFYYYKFVKIEYPNRFTVFISIVVIMLILNFLMYPYA